jgi:uncharacterized protein YqfA (UPF0365 family)
MFILAAPPPADNTLPVVVIVVASVFLLVLMITLAIFTRYFRLWFQAYMSRAEIGFFELLGMTLRKVNPNVIVRSKIIAAQAGLDESDGVSTAALEMHYLAGGNVPLVVQALVAARKAKLDLDFDRLAAIDLAGGDVMEAVRTGMSQPIQKKSPFNPAGDPL